MNELAKVCAKFRARYVFFWEYGGRLCWGALWNMVAQVNVVFVEPPDWKRNLARVDGTATWLCVWPFQCTVKLCILSNIETEFLYCGGYYAFEKRIGREDVCSVLPKTMDEYVMWRKRAAFLGLSCILWQDARGWHFSRSVIFWSSANGNFWRITLGDAAKVGKKRAASLLLYGDRYYGARLSGSICKTVDTSLRNTLYRRLRAIHIVPYHFTLLYCGIPIFRLWAMQRCIGYKRRSGGGSETHTRIPILTNKPLPVLQNISKPRSFCLNCESLQLY